MRVFFLMLLYFLLKFQATNFTYKMMELVFVKQWCKRTLLLQKLANISFTLGKAAQLSIDIKMVMAIAKMSLLILGNNMFTSKRLQFKCSVYMKI